MDGPTTKSATGSATFESTPTATPDDAEIAEFDDRGRPVVIVTAAGTPRTRVIGTARIRDRADVEFRYRPRSGPIS